MRCGIRKTETEKSLIKLFRLSSRGREYFIFYEQSEIKNLVTRDRISQLPPSPRRANSRCLVIKGIFEGGGIDGLGIRTIPSNVKIYYNIFDKYIYILYNIDNEKKSKIIGNTQKIT